MEPFTGSGLTSEKLCIATKEGTVEILSGTEPPITCKGQSGVTAISWYYTNEVIAVAGKKIALIRAKTGSILTTLASPTTTDVCFSSKSRYLYSSCEDKKTRIWDLKRKQLANMVELDSPVRCVSVNRNDTILASGLKSGNIVLHSTSNYDSPLAVIPSKPSSPMSKIIFSAFKSSILGSLSDKGDIKIWDINKQKYTAAFLNQHSAPAKAACFSTTNRSLFISGGTDKKICLFDVVNEKVVDSLNTDYGILDLSISGDGYSLCAAVSSGIVQQFDIRQFTGPVCAITSSDGSKIVRCEYQSTKVSKRTNLSTTGDTDPLRMSYSESLAIPGSSNILEDIVVSPEQYSLSPPFGESLSTLSQSKDRDSVPTTLSLQTRITSMKEDFQQKLDEISAEMSQQFQKQQEFMNSKFELLLEQNKKLLDEIQELKEQNQILSQKKP